MVDIKKLTIEDVVQLREVSIETYFDTFKEVNTLENLNKYFDEAYNIVQLTSEINDPNSEFYFVRVNKQVAGYLKVNINDAQSEPRGKDAFEVERIYIRSVFHRQGLGRKLLTLAMELAKRKEKSIIWLGVWENNFKAQKFYESFGFQHVGEHKFYTGANEETDWILEREL